MKQSFTSLFLLFFLPVFSQWHEISTPVTDPITDLFFVNNQVGYGTTSAGVVLKTTNGGASWTDWDIEATYLSSIWFTNESNGFALTTSLTSDRLFYHTTDGGQTWTKITSSLPIPKGGNQIFFTDAQTGYIAGATGTIAYLLKSTDGGTTWQSKGTFTYPLTSVFFSNSTVGYVGDKKGNIFKTTDAGETWNQVHDAQFDDVIQGFSFPSENIGYSVGETNGHVFKTTDGGNNWVETDQIYPSSLGTDILFVNENVGYITCFDYNDPYDMLKTTDGGATWTFDASYERNFRGGCITSRPDGVLFIGTLEGKILSSQVLSSVSDIPFASLSVFPNPNSGKLNIANIPAEFMEGTLEVYDAQARLVKTYPINTSAISLETNVEPGMYFGVVKGNNNQVRLGRWIVQ